jgi:hypothetical protein
MRTTFLILALLVSTGIGQSVRKTNLSNAFDVAITGGRCSDGGKCETAQVTLYRKGQQRVFQRLEGGRLSPSDLKDAVQFKDLDFDGFRDLIVFDGIVAPGGYATESQRIYLYSKKTRRFEFNPELSDLSKRENLGSFEMDNKRRLIFTYARPGGGVFQTRGYRILKGKPLLAYEQITDSTVAGGTKTKQTTRLLINGRWRVRVN